MPTRADEALPDLEPLDAAAVALLWLFALTICGGLYWLAVVAGSYHG